MGVTLTYQAIPPQSNFYARLQHDRAFRALSFELSPYGLFHLFKSDPIDFNEIMGDAIEGHPDIFCGTEIETSMLIGEFREGLRITCRDYPKIAGVSGSLEKSFEEVEDRLTEELSSRKFEDAYDIVTILLYGDTHLGENSLPDEDTWRLVSREAVKRGANVLRQIDPAILFPGEDEGWYFENFRSWKEFYLLVDDLGAEVLMDVI
jgi:hypothetical protein